MAYVLYDDSFEASIVNPAFWSIVGTGVSLDNARSHAWHQSVKTSPATGTLSYLAHAGAFPPVGSVRVWFFDDAGGGKKQVLFLMDAMNYPASVVSVGVDTDFSTTDYVYRIGNTAVATGVDRSAGWHEFAIEWNHNAPTSGTITTRIDGGIVGNSAYAFIPNEVRLGDLWSEAVTGPAWFDDFQLGTPT